jgi:hypothetical protein
MNALGVAPLARKITKAPPPEPTPEGRPKQPFAVQVRGRPEWKRWVAELAKANRQNVASVVDTALARLAKEMGFRDPPER